MQLSYPFQDLLSYSSSAAFEATPATGPPPVNQAAFFPTGGAPPAAQPPQRPQASADAILSLYNTGGSASRISGMGIPGPQQMQPHPGYGFPPNGFAPSQPGYPMHVGGYPQQQHQQQQQGMPMHAGYGGMQVPVNPFAPSNGGQMMMQPPAVPGQYPMHYGMQQPQHPHAPPPVPVASMQQQAMYGGMPSHNPPPVPVHAPMNPFNSQQGISRQPAMPQWPGRS